MVRPTFQVPFNCMNCATSGKTNAALNLKFNVNVYQQFAWLDPLFRLHPEKYLYR